MRCHLDQARVRIHAAKTQLRAGMNAGGYVKFTPGKEMMPDNINGANRVKFSRGKRYWIGKRSSG